MVDNAGDRPCSLEVEELSGTSGGGRFWLDRKKKKFCIFQGGKNTGLILATATRGELAAGAVNKDFTVIASEADWSPHLRDRPDDAVRLLSQKKAGACYSPTKGYRDWLGHRRRSGQRDSWQPSDEKEAIKCSPSIGRTHEVYTGVSLQKRRDFNFGLRRVHFLS